MREPIDSGAFAGEVLRERDWNQLLSKHYALEGWDPATGLQRESTLLALGLPSVAEKLRDCGKLKP